MVEVRSKSTRFGLFMIMFASGCKDLMVFLDKFLDSYFWYTKHEYNHWDFYTIKVCNEFVMLVGMFVGFFLFNKLQANIKCLIVCSLVIQIAGIVSSLSVNNYRQANAFYFMFVLGSGINLMLGLQCLWEYYPNRRFYVTGFISSAFYLGDFSISLITYYMLNP